MPAFPEWPIYMVGCFCGSRWGCRYYAAQGLYLSRHIKGIKRANIPFERPIKFEFIINLKAAYQWSANKRTAEITVVRHSANVQIADVFD
jgi:hypothetical protein